MEISAALETVAFWAGLTFGLSWALVLYVLHVMTGGPLQEALQEAWEAMRKRRRREPAAAPEAAQGGFGVLVSDLHIDTWFGPRASALPDPESAFVAFLTAVKAHPEIDSFYLAGDLMDIPLHPASHDEEVMLTLSPGTLEDRGVLLPIYDRVLGLLNDLTVPAPEDAPDAGWVGRSVFMTGNHDVGISGARYVRVRPPMPPYAPNAQIAWSPSLLVRHGAGGARYDRPFYVAHGHLLDPLLWLYLRYALLDALRQGYRHREEQIVTGFQRGGSVGMGGSAAGKDGAAKVAAAREAAAADPLASPWDAGARPRYGFLETVVRLRYRHAARIIFRDLRKRGHGDTRAVVMGHTHLPDRYTFPDGSVYVNSGDWAGDRAHRTYCLVGADGSVYGPLPWTGVAAFRAQVAALRAR